jgi:glucose/arabinose dehydrogenase
VNPARAVGWPDGETPIAAPGLAVNAFARNLDHPRWIYVLPNGDVLVAESRGPAKSGGFGGIRGWFAKRMMKYAGAAGVSADRITLLRDTDGDGSADYRSVFADNLHSPIGMALVGSWLYVATTDALVRFPYHPGDHYLGGPAETVVELPAGELNHHWTKNVIASHDGSRLYVAVGSNSNIGENGMDAEIDRAAILEVNPDTGRYRVFASGLRNPVGMDWHPDSGKLWTVVNERDELGNQLVPDYLASVQDGGFYGWPYSYWGQIVDQRVSPQDPALVSRALIPDYALGAHTASLGLAFYTHSAIPDLQGTAIIGQHGSWNRKPPAGYRVVAVRFENRQPQGLPEDLLSGFLSAEGEARGRPAGVAVARDGAILVADDVGDIIWRASADDAK